MAKFQSPSYADESYCHTKDSWERIYKLLRVNPTYIVALCEKEGEYFSPASIKLDTEVERGVSRGWEIGEPSDIESICESYLDYKPDSITKCYLNPETRLEMFAENLKTNEIMCFVWNGLDKTFLIK